jgi:hypothetical protein
VIDASLEHEVSVSVLLRATLMYCLFYLIRLK